MVYSKTVSAAALALLWAHAVTGDSCAANCSCSGSSMWCTYQDLYAAPAGQWPEVKSLDLSGNPLTALDADLGQRFPALTILRVWSSKLATLHLGALEGMEEPRFMLELELWGSAITDVVAPPEGLQIPQVSYINLAKNQLTHLQPEVFAALPKLKELSLADNPFVVPGDGPLLVHPGLTRLGLMHTDASNISPLTFSQLPSVTNIDLNGVGLSDIAGAFTQLPALDSIIIIYNNITQLQAGTFPPGRTMYSLYVGLNPLEFVDTAALPLKENGFLDISDSTMACACAHEHVALWAKQNAVRLNALCNKVDNCNFSLN